MIETDRNWALMCYIPVLNVITSPLCLVRRDKSKFCRLHARQGLVLFVFLFLTILTGFLSQVLSLMFWGIVLLFHGVGAYFAYNLKDTKLPLVGQLALKIPEHYIYTFLTGMSPENDDSIPEVDKKNDSNNINS